MTKMRGLAFVYWILIFRSMLFISIVHAWDRYQQVDDQRDNRDLDVIVNQRTSLGLFHPSWMTNVLLRSKRSDEIEEGSVPTRHAKHRKRRRCRNRNTCFRGIFTVQRSNETKEDAINMVPVSKEDPRVRPGVAERVQELYNETKGEDYDIADIDEEKDRTELNGETFVGKDKDTNDDIADAGLIESYDDLSPYTEGKFVKSRTGKLDETYTDETDSSAVYSAIDDQLAMHEGLSVLLSRLFQSLRNASPTGNRDIFKELNFVNGTSEDPCQKWLNSKDKLEQVFLGGLASLPACPCQYPSNIFYDDKIWDEKHKRYFRWRDVSGNSQRLDVYKPGATYCVRSLLTQGSGSAAAQHCCYDRKRNLLTRGSGAGTPYYVSPEISHILHERIDVLPWRLCKGDFSRYNGVRPPNNDNGCKANPDDEEYQRQIDDTKYY